MSTVIIDYGSGNLRSVEKAIRHVAPDAPLTITSDPEHIAKADRIILPGVGAFADCRRGLESEPGLIQALEQAVLERKVPFLGICVGMQLMAETGEEHGSTPGLGWLPARVTHLSPPDASYKLPHMGWNTLRLTGHNHPVSEAIDPALHVYFVHSYHMVALDLANSAWHIATTDYGQPVTAVVAKDNMVGVQFHPEKSQQGGLKILTWFMEWQP